MDTRDWGAVPGEASCSGGGLQVDIEVRTQKLLLETHEPLTELTEHRSSFKGLSERTYLSKDGRDQS